LKIAYSRDTIDPEDVIKWLCLTGGVRSACTGIIRNREVMKKANELGLAVSDEELQRFADTFRISLGLHSAQDTLAFLQRNGLSDDDFESFCVASLLTEKVKTHLADDKAVQEHFLNNRSSYEQARISSIVVSAENLASEISMRVTEDGEDFHALAREYSEEEATRHAGGYVGLIARASLSPEVASKVFTASAGDVVGPFAAGESFHLVLVEEIIKPELDDELKEKIKDRLFEEWVSQFTKNGIEIQS